MHNTHSLVHTHPCTRTCSHILTCTHITSTAQNSPPKQMPWSLFYRQDPEPLQGPPLILAAPEPPSVSALTCLCGPPLRPPILGSEITLPPRLPAALVSGDTLCSSLQPWPLARARVWL